MLPGSPAQQRHLSSMDRLFAIVMCCIVLLLSACSGQFGSADPSALQTPTLKPKPSPTSPPAVPKIEDNGNSPTIIERARLSRVQRIIADMSLDQKLGQLIIVEYLGNNYTASGLQYMISQQYVGGYLYQAVNGNFNFPDNTVSQAKQFAEQANHDAKIPLLIAIDQEGGQVNKLYGFYGYMPSAAAMAATGNPRNAQAEGAMAAKWMQSLGINTDLAPVVDVGPVSNLLENRQFSDNPTTVATYAGAFLNGLQSSGTVGCLKHFSGLGSLPGSVHYDPHDVLPVVNRSWTDLENIDLAPYKFLIEHDQPAMIMSTDVVTTAIDSNLPAELSAKAIDGVLRGQLGYNGVVITDGLYMGGIQARWSIAQAAVLAIIAGNDLIEGPFTPGQVANVVAALKQAIQQGQLTMDRINQSLQRILLLKLQYGIIK
jgi:beta-N-acetylhexosaminidase